MLLGGYSQSGAAKDTDTMAGLAGERKKGGSRVWLIIALALFIGTLVGLQFLNNINTTTAVEHDHDGDGKPDHGSEVSH
jgi:hypothetical protein